MMNIQYNSGLTALALALTLTLGACGSRESGDGDVGSTTVDGQGNSTDPSLGGALPTEMTFDLFSEETDIETGGTDAVIVTATLIDDQRLPVSGAEIDWSATGGVLQDRVTTTDANGGATATLRIPQDFRNSDIDVGVVSGSYESSITIRSYGTRMDVQGGEKSVVQGSDLELAVTLTAGNDEAIPNKQIAVTTANGNTVTPTVPVTDKNGRATFSVGSALGGDTVTIGALDDPSLTQSVSFTVSTDQLDFSTAGDSSEFVVNTTNSIGVRWSTAGKPVSDGELRVSTTAGQIVSDSVLRTDADGNIIIPIRSGSAGVAEIKVQDAVDGDPSNTFAVEFVATAPALADLSTTSSRVYVDGLSDITALVRDINGNPVKNREVVFTSNDLRGGQLSPSSAITDADGKARIGFQAGSNATVEDAIEVVGTVQGAMAANGMPLTSSVRLSVVERRLNVTVGASSVLQSEGLETQNARNMVVQVADGSGAPLPDAEVSLSITPIAFSKGHLQIVDTDGRLYFPPTDDKEWKPARWTYIHDTAPYSIECAAEDSNKNRILDLEQGEDINGNGMLDPQDPASLVAVSDADGYATLDGNGMLTTDANGTGYFRIVYPKGNANWAFLRITARANALGTEAQDSIDSRMLSLADELSDYRIVPANAESPYGTTLDCSVHSDEEVD